MTRITVLLLAIVVAAANAFVPANNNLATRCGEFLFSFGSASLYFPAPHRRGGGGVGGLGSFVSWRWWRGAVLPSLPPPPRSPRTIRIECFLSEGGYGSVRAPRGGDVVGRLPLLLIPWHDTIPMEWVVVMGGANGQSCSYSTIYINVCQSRGRAI
jgi:hypothetical protein